MGPKSTHQGVLQEYEKTKHRSDNSILRVMARVKNQNNLVKTATESPVTSSQSDHAQTMMTDVDIAQSLIHKGKVYCVKSVSLSAVQHRTTSIRVCVVKIYYY